MKNDRVEVTEETNTLKVETASVGIKTLDELLTLAKVDLNTWDVYKHEINTWPTSMKTGDGEPVSIINHQIKAYLKRREPIEIIPTIKPIKFKKLPKPRKKTPKKHDKKLKTAVVLSDPHFGFLQDIYTKELTPFHDRLALSCAYKLALDIRPDVIIWNGDVLDLPMMGKYLKHPEFYFTLQSAIVEAAWWLRLFKSALPRADHYVMRGNHDIRLENATIERNVAAFGLKAANELHLPPAQSIPKLLGLHDMGINYIADYPDGAVWLNPRTPVMHGNTASGGSGATAHKLVNKLLTNAVIGHIHRQERVTKTVWINGEPKEITAVCGGCLCRVDGVVPGRQKQQNWQNGITKIHYTPDYEEFHIVPMRNGRSYHHGAVFSGEDWREEIIKSTGWENL